MLPQELLPVICIKKFLIIEEPEAHLFPNAQWELVKLISLVINTTKSECLVIL